MAKRRLPPRDPKTGRFVKRGSKRTRRKAGRRRKGKR